MAPFYGWGATALRLHSLRGGSLLFTIQFPEIPGTQYSLSSSRKYHHKITDDRNKSNDDAPRQKSNDYETREKVIIVSEFMLNNINSRGYQNLKTLKY